MAASTILGMGVTKCDESQGGPETRVNRIKWLHDAGSSDQTSACGRFVIRPVCLDPKFWGYWGLTDTSTGEEFPCRTEASAKAAARNLLKRA